MKRYTKPIIQKDVVMDVNESVFLSNSGDIFDEGDCFWVNDLYRHQELETGRTNQVYQMGVMHTCEDLTLLHDNTGQNWVVHLTKPIPLDSYVTCDSMVGQRGDISSDGYEVRFVRNLWANAGNEDIRMGSLTIDFHNFTDDMMNGLEVNGLQVNDYGYRVNFRNP